MKNYGDLGGYNRPTRLPALDTTALTCSFKLGCSSKMTPRYLNSATRFIADPLLIADPISVYRTKRKSLSLQQCRYLLPCQHALWPWADRCSFEDSCEHQETLWSSPDCKHLESRKQPCNIASQLSFLYQLNVILPWYTGCHLSSDLNEVLVSTSLSCFQRL